MRIKRAVVITGLLWLSASGITLAQSELETTISTLIENNLYGEALETLKSIEATDADYAVAQRLIGTLYAKGLGVEADPVNAVKLYRAAAQGGDSRAEFLLAQAYESGAGIAESVDSALTWYEKAADSDPDAALRYAEIVLANEGKEGLIVNHDPDTLLKFAASEGRGRAKYLLAQRMLNSDDGKNQEEAVELMEEASETQGEANTVLGLRAHKAGDFQVAKALFLKALELGDTDAAAYLGHYAEHGIEEETDRQAAFDFYSQASEIDWAKEALRRLNAHAHSIQVFGVPVYGVPRVELRQRFTQLGLKPLKNDSWFDAFDATPQLGDRKGIVTVAYAPETPRYVGEITVQFITENRSELKGIYEDVNAALKKQYGTPASNGKKKGQRITRWIQDEIGIQLVHNNNDQKVEVMYRLQPYFELLREAVAQSNKEGLDNAL